MIELKKARYKIVCALKREPCTWYFWSCCSIYSGNLPIPVVLVPALSDRLIQWKMAANCIIDWEWLNLKKRDTRLCVPSKGSHAHDISGLAVVFTQLIFLSLWFWSQPSLIISDRPTQWKMAASCMIGNDWTDESKRGDRWTTQHWD